MVQFRRWFRLKNSKSITSVEVAKLVGVSQATVSRAFNNPEKVDPETKRRIMAVARRCHYIPNAIAKSLVSRKTNIIGAVIEDFENPFYVSFVYRLAEKLAESGKKVLLFNPCANENVEMLLQEARSFRVDGLVIASAILSQQLLEKEIPATIPVVMINRQSASGNYCSVASDDVSCGRMVADYFIRQNRYKSYCYVAGADVKPSSINRRRGFKDRLCEWGIRSLIQLKGDYTYISGKQAAMALLNKKIELPLAVFAANDLMALGLLDELKYTSQYNIPTDISIIGVDNIEQSCWASYNLTTMQLPIEEMIQCAFRYIDAADDARVQNAGRHLFPCTLIVRGTA